MNREDVMRMAMRAGLLDKIDCSDHYFIPADAFIDEMEKLANLAYEAGRKDENEACASLEVHLITPTRDYTTMSPLDCYEAALMDEAMAFRAAIRARREQ